MEGTDTYETGYRTETFEDDTKSPRYSFVDDEKPDGELRILQVNKYKLFINIKVNKLTKAFYLNCYFWYT